MPQYLHITMPDTSVWSIPVEIIARNRAAEYAHEFDGDIEKSLAEDTLPLFESDDYEIHDWAANNMNWKDVSEHATQISEPQPIDFQEGWMNGGWVVSDTK